MTETDQKTEILHTCTPISELSSMSTMEEKGQSKERIYIVSMFSARPSIILELKWPLLKAFVHVVLLY